MRVLRIPVSALGILFRALRRGGDQGVAALFRDDGIGIVALLRYLCSVFLIDFALLFLQFFLLLSQQILLYFFDKGIRPCLGDLGGGTKIVGSGEYYGRSSSDEI